MGKTIEINLSVLILIVILIVVIIFAGIKFFGPTKQKSSDEGSTKTSSTTPKSVTLDFSNISDDELISLLYSYICAETRPGFYRTETVTVDSLSNRDKILTVCMMLDDGTRSVISEKDFEERFYQIFGKDATFEHATAYINNIIGGYIFENGQYEIDTSGAGGINYTIFTKKTRAEQSGDYIIIYDRYMLYLFDANYEELWGDTEGNVVIAKVEDTEEEESIWNNFDSPVSTYDATINYLIEKFQYEIPIYKHTFKKEENGGYIWVSSEPYVPERTYVDR